MDDIDFIKWLCEKAEDFSIKLDNEKHGFPKSELIVVSPSGFNYRFPENKFKNINNVNRWDSEVCPLLLQRAIEGVNREDNGIFIDQHNDGCDIVFKSIYRLSEKCRLNGGTYDQAKDSALKYIKEQEPTK